MNAICEDELRGDDGGGGDARVHDGCTNQHCEADACERDGQRGAHSENGSGGLGIGELGTRLKTFGKTKQRGKDKKRSEQRKEKWWVVGKGEPGGNGRGNGKNKTEEKEERKKGEKRQRQRNNDSIMRRGIRRGRYHRNEDRNSIQ